MENVLNIRDHITLTSGNSVSQLCMPIFEYLDVACGKLSNQHKEREFYFCFHRIYEEGDYIRLSSNPYWTEYSFKSGYFARTEDDLKKALSFAKSYIFGDYMRRLAPGTAQISEEMNAGFAVCYPLVLINSFANYTDIFLFSTNPANKDIQDVYASDMEPLQKFTHFFLQKAFPLLNEAEKQRLQFSQTPSKQLSTSDRLIDLEEERKKLYEVLQIKNLCIKTSSGIITLSKRETESLILLAKNLSTKEIARELKLSPETVKSYLKGIKVKLGSFSRNELIKKIHASEARHLLFK